jgi:hypothetical protein
MTIKHILEVTRFWVFVFTLVLGFFNFGNAQSSKNPLVIQNNGNITILVTAMPNNDRTSAIADRLIPGDFEVLENKLSQKIISARKAESEPIQFAVVIQDNLVSRVNNELKEIKDFITGLPEDSSVMTAYISVGSLRIAQEFTTDKARAADSLRIITSSDMSAPFSPFIQTQDALKLFAGQPEGRRILLLISTRQFLKRKNKAFRYLQFSRRLPDIRGFADTLRTTDKARF